MHGGEVVEAYYMIGKWVLAHFNGIRRPGEGTIEESRGRKTTKG